MRGTNESRDPVPDGDEVGGHDRDTDDVGEGVDVGHVEPLENGGNLGEEVGDCWGEEREQTEVSLDASRRLRGLEG